MQYSWNGWSATYTSHLNTVLCHTDLCTARFWRSKAISAGQSCSVLCVQLLCMYVQVKDVEDMDWGMNTDLHAAFSLILQRALDAKIRQDQMIETLFIFSDMQFDSACYSYGTGSGSSDSYWGNRSWGARHVTNYTVAQEEFERNGYKLPKVVFWNLRGYGLGESASVPVTHTEEGTALVSGFSGQLLKLFMDGVQELESFDPFNIMKEAIGKEKYNGWKVID